MIKVPLLRSTTTENQTNLSPTPRARASTCLNEGLNYTLLSRPSSYAMREGLSILRKGTEFAVVRCSLPF